MKWLGNLSLKFKLLILLVLLTGTMLSIYGFLVLRDFENDKIAYVLDSSRAHSQAVTLQLRTEIGHSIDQVRSLMKNFNPASSEQSISFKAQLQELKNLISADFWMFDPVQNQYNAMALIPVSAQDLSGIELIQSLSKKLKDEVLKNEVAVSLKNSPFQSHFQISQVYDTYLVSLSAEKDKIHAVIEPSNKSYELDSQIADLAFKKALDSIPSGEGVTDFRDRHGKIWLISSSALGLGGLRIFSFVPKSAALETVRMIVIKSILFFLFLLFATVFISVLASSGLTKSLHQLLFATRSIAEGDFQIKVPANRGDEVGILGQGINRMAVEIQRLLREVIEKTRMEGELKTAQLVQSTLFPTADFCDANLEIRGYNRSASECSGDWWHYQKINNKILFCIGDATGHGVGAALLTSAARSAASTLETFPDLSIQQMMSVFKPSKGKTCNRDCTRHFSSSRSLPHGPHTS